MSTSTGSRFGLGRGDRVEGDRSGIRAGPLRDDRHADQLGPDAELLDGRGAEGVGGREGERVTLGARRAASLPIVVVLPVPLTPTKRTMAGGTPSSK